MSMCNCRDCGKWFTGAAVFDLHRVGGYERLIFATNAQGKQTRKVIGRIPNTRRCLTETEMLAKGMKQNERGTWTSGKERPAFWGNQGQPAAEEDIA